jgi:hypothetical protein
MPSDAERRHPDGAPHETPQGPRNPSLEATYGRWLGGIADALEHRAPQVVVEMDLVRGAQTELLFQFCYFLEDPGIEEDVDMCWALVQMNQDGEVLGPIGGLHESVLETDPTGREMRPRP